MVQVDNAQTLRVQRKGTDEVWSLPRSEVQKLSPALEPLLVADLVRMAFEEGASTAADAPTNLRWYYGRVVKVVGVDSDLCDI